MTKGTLFVLAIAACACTSKKGWLSSVNEPDRPLFAENFTGPLDTSVWTIEMDSLPNSTVYALNGSLILDTKGGVTVWLKQTLTGNYEIEYKRTVVMQDGPNDRLSDMNQFWMANDPQNTDLFTRKGKFEEYDSLALYYAGIGGNTNTTTRFRRYDGHGTKQLLIEKNDTAHLLRPNHEYLIKLRCVDGLSSLWVDGQEYFNYQDPQAFTSGRFGFRSTWSRQQIRDFKIYRLK